MENLAHAIRQFQAGAIGRADFFAHLDRILAASPAGAGRLLEVLSEEHAKAPLSPDVYTDVQRRIQTVIAASQRLGGDDTYVQTRPDRAAARPDEPPDAGTERVKGVGDTLNGRFVLEECIGFGGMGTVYKALDLRKLEASDRKPYIAIKVLNVQFRGHPKSLIALQREARKAQTLAHPNIVSVYDFDRDGAMVYLTMEYLSGKSLSQVLRDPLFKGMPYSDAMRIVTGMGKALAYAHERGFVHCDFKPGNVFLTDNGTVKVIDFGIARVFQKAEEEVDVTVFDPGSLGALTPAYASPEMLEHGEPDPRDDIYALACITYELLTGRHPFDRLSALQARSAGMKPKRPESLGRAKWHALKCALAFERSARTPTVTRFLEQIGEHGPAPRSVGLIAAGLAAAVLAIVALRQFWPGRAIESGQRAPAASEQAAAPAIPAATAEQASASASPPAPAAAPVPAPVPAPTAGALAAALAKVSCAALAPSVQNHAVRVEGYVARSFGLARLDALLGAIPGVQSVALDVVEVDADKCGVLTTFAPYWSANHQAGRAAGMRMQMQGPVSGHATELTEGDALMVDITTPAYDSYVTIDYFVLDASVVHLLPNVRARDNFATARYTATIGSMGNWVIGRPFGTEMIVMLTTPVPLFDGLRPESEPGADYLRAAEKQLAQIKAKYGTDRIAVDFAQITTKARKR